MLRNIFVWVFFDVDYPLKADSKLDIELLRASNLSLARKLEGITDSYLFIFCGDTTLEQASDIVDKYQFAERHVTTIARPEMDKYDMEPFDFGDLIDHLVEHWLHNHHPGALTYLNSTSKAGFDVWWSGIASTGSEYDFSDDFAATLPSNHKDKANTWLEILNQAFPFTEGSLHEEQEFLVIAASLCKWLHGFEEAADNGYDDFDPASVITALPFEDFYLGYLLGQYRPDSEFYAVMEDSDSESIHDLKAFALQEALKNDVPDIRDALLEFFGGGTGLFWALYTAIWQSFSKSSETNCCNRLGDFTWNELHELIGAWEYAAGGSSPAFHS